MRYILLITAMLVSAFVTSAETPFNGLIQDSELKPIKGAKVWVSNPRKYAKSDGKGRFGLTDVKPTDTLHISIKKDRYDIPVDGAKSLRIIITDQKVMEAAEDSKLVDLGFGYVTRREYNSPSNGISGDRLRATGRKEILEALVGLVPGLERHPDGRVTIRGNNSFLSPPSPLYVVDGIIVPDFLNININDVESVEVLKDGAIYGSRGAGGVILVRTKTGAI